MLLVALFGTPLPTTEPEPEPSEAKVTAEDVLSWMAELPPVEVPHTAEQKKPAHWEKIGNAPELAAVIAKLAPNRDAASLMTVYEVFEGGNQKCAVGDGGKALGPFQLQGVPESVACDAEAAGRVWLRKAKDSWETCKHNLPDEKLALLASGRCDKGHVLARRRAKYARDISAEPASE